MNNLIISFFTNNGTPQSGLIPTIDIVDAESDSIIIDSETMETIISMPYVYKYDFTNYDRSKTYAITVDGGSGLADLDRYQFAVNENSLVESDVISLSGIINNSESNIRGEDSDTLKTLSDQLDSVTVTVTPTAKFNS